MPALADFTIQLDATSGAQHQRLLEWHDKTHVMHVAHTKAAAREALKSKALGVAVAICGAVTGTTMFVEWQKSTDSTIQALAAFIGLAGVILAAVQTTMSYGKHSAEHAHAGVQYGKLRRQMEEWRLEHPHDEQPSADDLKAWLKTWLEVESASPVVTDGELKRAEARVFGGDNPPPNPW